MSLLRKNQTRFCILFAIILTILLNLPSAQANVDPWPPFRFDIDFSYEDNQITYTMLLRSEVEWPIADAHVVVPIPEGTQFVEADALPTTSVNYNGQEVSFLTSVLHRPIRDMAVVVEITDPSQTVFETDIFVSWKGDHPGSYTFENVTFDTTKKPLNFDRLRPWLDLSFIATVGTDDTITYTLYPTYIGWLRMWDLRINVPVPAGTRFLSVNAPVQYSTDYDGEVVYFKISELPGWTGFGPLRFTVSTADVPDGQLVKTHAWAVWKNAGRAVGRRFPLEEEIITGDLIVEPRVPQEVLNDLENDVPLPYYDVVSLALADDGPDLKVTFYMAGYLNPNDPAVFSFFIDQDCRTDTGLQRDGRGMDWQVRYRNQRVEIVNWLPDEGRWNFREATVLRYEHLNNRLSMWVPLDIIGTTQICWSGVARTETQDYTPNPPGDRVPSITDVSLTRYQVGGSQLNAQLDQALEGQEVVVIPMQVTGEEEQEQAEELEESVEEEAAEAEQPAPAAPTQPTASEELPTAAPAEPTTAAPQPTETPRLAQAAPTPTQQPPNQQQTVLEDDFISLGDTWFYQPGWQPPPTNWAAKDFNEGDWLTGETIIGYGDRDFATNLSLSLSFIQQGSPENSEQADSEPNNPNPNRPRTDFTSFYMRHNFNLDQPDNISRLTMKIDYGDGFVAYLNGEEVARRGLRSPGTEIPFDALATDRQFRGVETIDLSNHIGKLQAGENTLALQVHKSLGRSSMFAGPELTWERNGRPLAVAPTATPPPAQAEQEEEEGQSGPAAQPPPTQTQAVEPTATATPEQATEPTPTQTQVPALAVAPTVTPSPTAVPPPATAEAPPPAPTETAAPVAETGQGSFAPAQSDTLGIETIEGATPVPADEPTPDLNLPALPETQETISPPDAIPSSEDTLYVPNVGVPEDEPNSYSAGPDPEAPPVDYKALTAIQPDPTIEPPQFGSPDPNPSLIDTEGKIVIPVDNGQGLYDLKIYRIRFGYGWEDGSIIAARQPHLRSDGERMLINREGDGLENIYEYNFLDGTERRVSDNPLDSHPVYDPWGNRVAYNNPKLVLDPVTEQPFSHLIVQCGLIPPHLETDDRCRDIASFGLIIPSGRIGRIEGSHPVWAIDNHLYYKGCNTWAGASACGIYKVPSGATPAFSDGAIPLQITYHTSDIPSDTEWYYLTFTTERDGNWEAYIMNLDGNNIRNLSNSPGSNDGLPTISPDGNWVAFVSDRGGQWAVWAVPIVGGTPQKLFDFPTNAPWSTGDRSWTNERITWGP